jgi:3-deoxy-D-manno-octulosonic-acid transferase
MGPHTANFAQAAELALAAGAAFRVQGLPQALVLARDLVHDAVRLEAARLAGMQFAAGHRGAAMKTATAIRELLAESSARGFKAPAVR